jgi:hypothetical protein
MPTRNVIINANLRDTDYTPIANKTISFKYRTTGSTTWTDAGTATTNQFGDASRTVSLNVPGTYDFRVEFAGDATYEASSAELLNQTIKAKTTLSITILPQ